MKARIGALLLVGALAGIVVFATTASSSVPGPLFASLSGHNEIPDADPDGIGGFTALIDGDQFCYGLTVTNLDTPTGAHVHEGNAGENGPIVISLTAPATGDPGTSSACVTADTSLLNDILQHPSQYYVNVHTTEFTGGAIRDQLGRLPH
jgi:CHRD domain